MLLKEGEERERGRIGAGGVMGVAKDREAVKAKKEEGKEGEEGEGKGGGILSKSIDLKCDVFVSYCWADKRIVFFLLQYPHHQKRSFSF